MKEDYPWMKQVRPLKRLWDQRKRIEKEFEEFSKTTGKHGGNIQGIRQQKVLSKRRGIKRLSDKYRKSALEQLFGGLKDWFNKQRSAGNYVDREDLWIQYNYVAKKAVAISCRKKGFTTVLRLSLRSPSRTGRHTLRGVLRLIR